MRSAHRGARAGLIAVWLLAAAASPAADRPAGLPASKLEQVEQAVAAEMARLKIPGMSVAIATDFQVAWTGGFGVADLENSVPAQGATVYRLGSICKPITAVAVLQLAERGKLDLDAPIQKYVPAFPRKPWPITARELLGHLSGIRHYRSAGEINSTRHYADLLEPLKLFEDEPLLFEPGTHYLYTTYGYNLLGAAVEGASGKKFLDYLRENVFSPAGMEQIRQDNVYAIVPHRARGYQRGPGGEIQNCAPADTSSKVPGGGMISTAGDLVRFVTALERGVLLTKPAVEQMFTSQRTRDGRPTGYGLGWKVVELGGRKWVGHSGSQQGASAVLLSLPTGGVTVALMANLEGVNLGALASRLAELVLP